MALSSHCLAVTWLRYARPGAPKPS